MATNYGIYGEGFNPGTGGFANIILRSVGGEHKTFNRETVILALQSYQGIKDALQTEEDGTALIEVARNACRAEYEYAARQNKCLREVR